MDRERGLAFFSFTDRLVKTDLDGTVLGSITGLPAHLGDITLNPKNGKVYGSIFWGDENPYYAPYIAIFDPEQMHEIDESPERNSALSLVHLKQLLADRFVDLDGDGTDDGLYATAGVDGVGFGPRFGSTTGDWLLTVTHSQWPDVDREDNDHQILVQYDPDVFDTFAKPYDTSKPDPTSGPTEIDGQYFVFTGATRWGIQNLTYDPTLGRWFMGVYAGSKPEFPNFTMFAVEAASQPVRQELRGVGVDGDTLPLAEDGLEDAATGIRGWFQKADVGFQAMGDGLYYLCENSVVDGLQAATLTLSVWTDHPHAPFAPAEASEPFESAPQPRIISKDPHGRIKPGALLVAEAGTWQPQPTLTYRWLADGIAIEGASSERFRLTGKWKGAEITVEVSAELEGYDPTAVTSAPVRVG
ncbi:MAG: hypothetical protein ACTMKY_13710 [Dermabacteraceae bacterium]